jgi:hypothetical protein
MHDVSLSGDAMELNYSSRTKEKYCDSLDWLKVVIDFNRKVFQTSSIGCACKTMIVDYDRHK